MPGVGEGDASPLKFWVISTKLLIGSFAFLKHWVEGERLLESFVKPTCWKDFKNSTRPFDKSSANYPDALASQQMSPAEGWSPHPAALPQQPSPSSPPPALNRKIFVEK